ncbi:MAG: HAMP domain-containing histidine kinase, partial [Acidobacteriota bacterium]|nr:HAMP domain-containing histidine kinase [Acidobacteriota bacterium]
EAERANAVKDEFLAAVSHELRTPLTTIKTLTRVLQRREMTETEREEYLADIASECDREIDLVLNLLDLSRIKAGGAQIELKPTNAAEVVRACEKLFRGEAERHNQKISIEIAANLPVILADHSALRRALCAIAENAIKFTPENGRITLRTTAIGDEVAIEIEDTGRGIAAQDLTRVFEKFYRGNNAGGGTKASAEEVPGIGLGLNRADHQRVGRAAFFRRIKNRLIRLYQNRISGFDEFRHSAQKVNRFADNLQNSLRRAMFFLCVRDGDN